MHSNPWLRLLRREVEALVKKKRGDDYLKVQQAKAELAGINRTLKQGLPVAWHALWRLPLAMAWSEPGGKPWMRYPAVSFVGAVRPLR